MWCIKCAAHVLPDGEPWNRTYYAQHRKLCPYNDLMGGHEADDCPCDPDANSADKPEGSEELVFPPFGDPPAPPADSGLMALAEMEGHSQRRLREMVLVVCDSAAQRAISSLVGMVGQDATVRIIFDEAPFVPTEEVLRDLADAAARDTLPPAGNKHKPASKRGRCHDVRTGVGQLRRSGKAVPSRILAKQPKARRGHARRRL